ncbi:hypothetical protein [Streptomyces sp. MBT53]|uniref:hypothetical protein n=1 Tax=Streptomyces sp. MBT53 TaxID=1488384 RepID=UPI001F485E98|nr:hypothetical protein [Streptomyces sp. MBT53]
MLPYLRRAAPAALSAVRVRLALWATSATSPHAYRADATTGVVLAAGLTTGGELKDWVLLVAGNILTAIIAVRGVGHFMKKEWGEMVTMGVAAVFVGAYVWAPDTVQDVLTGIWGKVSGSA